VNTYYKIFRLYRESEVFGLSDSLGDLGIWLKKRHTLFRLCIKITIKYNKNTLDTLLLWGIIIILGKILYPIIVNNIIFIVVVWLVIYQNHNIQLMNIYIYIICTAYRKLSNIILYLILINS